MKKNLHDEIIDLTIVIPAFNEEHSIGNVVTRIMQVCEKNQISHEIIVVNDGSEDATSDLAEKAGAYVISHPYNIGNGAAVKTGIRAARGNNIVMMDGDGQHDPVEIPNLYALLDRYKMVVGARQSNSKTPIHRDIANIIYNWLASYICNMKIEDLTSGYRAIKTRTAKEFLHLLPNTFSYPSTLTLAVARSGFPFTYYPIRVTKRKGRSKIKIVHDGMRFLLIIFKVSTLFSPLKVFLPASIGLFFLGFGYGLFKVVFLNARYGPTSALLMTMSGLVFLIGLVSEQLTQLRYEK